MDKTPESNENTKTLKDKAIEDAKKLLEEQTKEDLQNCQKEINEVLIKFGCKLQLDVAIQGDKVIKRVGVIKG